MDLYGDFSASINRLESSLSSVRTVWTDQTAASYDVINDNMKDFAKAIWSYYQNAVQCDQAIRANYNESEFNEELLQASAKIEAV